MINHRTIAAFLIAAMLLGLTEACAQNEKRRRVKTHTNSKQQDQQADSQQQSGESAAGEEEAEPSASPTEAADGAGDGAAVDGGDAAAASGGEQSASPQDAAGPLYYWAVTGRPAQSIPLESTPISKDITLFYATGLGRFPKVVTVNDVRKGGVPQAADMQAHLEKVRDDIERRIPDPNWDGYAVINYEEWFGRPLWETAPEQYKEYSRLLIKRENPYRSPHLIEADAKEAYEQGARTFITETLRVCKEMRPNTKWGFFMYFPHFKSLEELSWAWEVSDAFFPSVYLPYFSVDSREADRPWEQPSEVNRRMIEWRMGEMRKIAGDRPVLAFIKTVYHGTNPHYGGLELNELDRKFSLETTLEAGADGVIFWDHLDEEQEARAFERRLMKRFVPHMERVVERTAAAPQ